MKTLWETSGCHVPGPKTRGTHCHVPLRSGPHGAFDPLLPVVAKGHRPMPSPGKSHTNTGEFPGTLRAGRGSGLWSLHANDQRPPAEHHVPPGSDWPCGRWTSLRGRIAPSRLLQVSRDNLGWTPRICSQRATWPAISPFGPILPIRHAFSSSPDDAATLRSQRGRRLSA